MLKSTHSTIFHITHQKAGSQWVAEVLKYCTLDRFRWPQVDLSFFYNTPIRPGKIYLTVYVPKPDFDMMRIEQEC